MIPAQRVPRFLLGSPPKSAESHSLHYAFCGVHEHGDEDCAHFLSDEGLMDGRGDQIEFLERGIRTPKQAEDLLRADHLSDALPESPRHRPRVLEEAVDRGVAGEPLDEGAAGIRVFLAGPEQWL
jgi:hypothetical protein